MEKIASVNAIYRKLSQIIPKPGKKHSAIGLDIGNFSVKLVKMESQNNIYRVSALGIEEVQHGNVKDATKAVLDKAAAGTKDVNVGISGKQIVMRCILLPDMKEADFKNSMRYEAAKHIPFPIDKVILDFCILKHNLDNNKMLVLITAAKKDFVDARLKIISDLGITPSVLDIDSLAVMNIFNLAKDVQQQSKGMSAILNIGSQLSGLALIDGDLLSFSRDITFGGNDITTKISTKFGIDFVEAEKKKLTPSHTSEVRESIESSLVDLVTELRLSFDYYEGQTGRAVDCVYLSGGGSCLKGIDSFMQGAMNITFKIWSPFSGLQLDEHLDKKLTENLTQRFAVAAGLALR